MPVEIGTYDQVKAILEDGEYYIGRRRQKEKVHYFFNCVEEIVTLRSKKSVKQKYTLNELKELESKVVLIRDHSSSVKTIESSMADSGIISGSDSVTSKDIEKFLNVRYIIV